MRLKRGGVSPVGLLQAAAIVTVFLSVLTYFDWAHYNIELFSHFRLQYLAAAALLATLFAIMRSAVYSGVLIVTAVFNASMVLPWYFAETPEADGKPLKLMLVNVHSHSTNYQQLIEFVFTETPDLVFLQEVTDDWLDAMQALKAEYAFSYAEPREGNFGIAVFSRIPLDTVTHTNSPPLQYPTILAEVTIEERALTLISTHPTIPLGRSGYKARNEHLDSLTSLAEEARDATILIGDLNASPWCHSYRRLLAKTGLQDARRGFGILPTWPTFMPFAMIPIDHALVSTDVGVRELRRGPDIGSDHLPLILTVAL